MSKSSVMIQLEPGQVEALDARARREGVSRSHLIRRAVDDFLSPPADLDVAARYVEAYGGGRSVVDEWGDLDAWHDAAAADRATAERDPW